MYDTHDQPAQRQHKLAELIKDIEFATFATHTVQGHRHSRPLTTPNKRIADDSLWFFMSRSGDPVAEFEGDDQVYVSYANPSSDTYVSVSGTAQVVEDAAKKQALWNKAAEAWFEGDVDDPDLALVRVRIEHADYWDVTQSKLVQLYKMGEHGDVRPH